MNMVRAGVVKHPCDWSASGYHEIQTPSQRYRIVDLEALKYLLEIDSLEKLQQQHQGWIDNAINHREIGGREQLLLILGKFVL
jgi:putative transposase